VAGKVRVRVILLGCIIAILTWAAIQQHIVGRRHMEENVHIEDRPIRVTPPNKEEIAYRALCLGALIMRGEFEQVVQDTAQVLSDVEVQEVLIKGHEELTAKLNAWLTAQGLTSHLSEREKALFAKPLGAWTRQEIIDVSWRGESLGVLLWSLSLRPRLLGYDTQFSQDDIIKPLGLMMPVDNFLKRAKLRPVKEIARARDVAELWHWRSRTTYLQQTGDKPPEGITYAEIIEKSAEFAYKDGIISRPIKGDFPLFGKPYSALSEMEYSVCTSIAMERHCCLNWLCGYSKDWDKTPTDT
jgi:hypothetical protein